MPRPTTDALRDAGLQKQEKLYRADDEACNVCPRKTECTDSGKTAPDGAALLSRELGRER